jgi:RNA exonuclease 1
MKRSQASMAQPTSPLHKKLKMTSPSESPGLPDEGEDDGWTKVEKRKVKKAKKVEAKFDVCVSIPTRR